MHDFNIINIQKVEKQLIHNHVIQTKRIAVRRMNGIFLTGQSYL